MACWSIAQLIRTNALKLAWNLACYRHSNCGGLLHKYRFIYKLSCTIYRWHGCLNQTSTVITPTGKIAHDTYLPVSLLNHHCWILAWSCIIYIAFNCKHTLPGRNLANSYKQKGSRQLQNNTTIFWSDGGRPLQLSTFGSSLKKNCPPREGSHLPLPPLSKEKSSSSQVPTGIGYVVTKRPKGYM